MKIKKQIELASKITNLPLMLTLVSAYAIVYGTLFGAIFNKGNLYGILFQTCFWFLVYGYIFFGIAGGSGILSIFYALISLGRDRKTAFSIWSMTILLSTLFTTIFLIPFFVFGKYFVDREYLIPVFTMNISQSSINQMEIIKVLILIGIGMFLNILIAFFCTIGVRFGWQITVGTILLAVSVILILFFADINILFVTGHNIYRYLIGIYGLSIILYGGIFFLSQKWEVKN